MRNLRNAATRLSKVVMAQAFVAVFNVTFNTEYRFLSLIIMSILLFLLLTLDAVIAFMEDLQEMRENETEDKHR